MLFDRGIVAPAWTAVMWTSDSAFRRQGFPWYHPSVQPRHPALPEGEPQRRALCQREQPLQRYCLCCSSAGPCLRTDLRRKHSGGRKALPHHRLLCPDPQRRREVFPGQDGRGDRGRCILQGDTIEELADKLGFTGEAKDTFLATVERYNELYDKQNDEDFGKPAYRLSAIRTAPFYGCWLGASLLTTEQGIAINDKGQALDNDNKPMPGLYITGDMSGSFFANNYPCLMAGVAMGRTLTFAMKSIKQMAGLE